eukprot:Rhum_TRINITY_DN919_c0_g1::Rhum_TRINITY_DN919_c0_g1_i1::g.2763::m.2763
MDILDTCGAKTTEDFRVREGGSTQNYAGFALQCLGSEKSVRLHSGTPVAIEKVIAISGVVKREAPLAWGDIQCESQFQVTDDGDPCLFVTLRRCDEAPCAA